MTLALEAKCSTGGKGDGCATALALFSEVDDADAALTSLSGTYTAWHRYDRVDQGVRETLRVAAFDDSPAADDIRPAAVYDYSFFLRRRAGR